MWYCDPTSSAISSKVQCHDTVTDITASTDSQLAKEIELDDRRPGRQFEPYLTAGCVCTAAAVACQWGRTIKVVESSRCCAGVS